MNNEHQKNNKIIEALNDLDKAKKNLEIAIENLKQANENFRISKNNFSNYNQTKLSTYSNVMSTIGNPSIDERIKLLNSFFSTCIIEDDSQKQIFIIDESRLVK